MQVFYLGRAPRTKKTLPDFLKWHRVTRHPLVFHGLTGSQRTPKCQTSHILSSSSIWMYYSLDGLSIESKNTQNGVRTKEL